MHLYKKVIFLSLITLNKLPIETGKKKKKAC
jgi:hypothetical protein